MASIGQHDAPTGQRDAATGQRDAGTGEGHGRGGRASALARLGRAACRRERVFLMVGVWLAVYPSVTLLTYLTEDLDAPVFAKTFLTTILTVPFITFVVVPTVKRLIARAEEEA